MARDEQLQSVSFVVVPAAAACALATVAWAGSSFGFGAAVATAWVFVGVGGVALWQLLGRELDSKHANRELNKILTNIYIHASRRKFDGCEWLAKEALEGIHRAGDAEVSPR